MSERELPPEIADGARLEGNEYGWEPSLFPATLANAQALGYACIGGQFQFRLDIGTCEMYWLSPHFSPGVILWAAGGVIKPVRLLLS
jgi:hypothetical protein